MWSFASSSRRSHPGLTCLSWVFLHELVFACDFKEYFFVHERLWLPSGWVRLGLIKGRETLGVVPSHPEVHRRNQSELLTSTISQLPPSIS